LAQCISCGTELHPDRARKYNYCTAPECQEKNAKGLTMIAIGMNKAADELLILDDRTRQDLAAGKYHDQRRGSFGPVPRQPGSSVTSAARRLPPRTRSQSFRPAATDARRPPWTPSQERLALLYNEQRLRPAEIAGKLGISSYLVTQIILAAKNREKA
jgi:hypothetical protein